MVKALIKKVIWNIILSTLILSWRCVEYAMTKFTSIRAKAEKRGGSYESDQPPVFDPYSSSQSASSISVEEDILQDMANFWDKTN